MAAFGRVEHGDASAMGLVMLCEISDTRPWSGQSTDEVQHGRSGARRARRWLVEQHTLDCQSKDLAIATLTLPAGQLDTRWRTELTVPRQRASVA